MNRKIILWGFLGLLMAGVLYLTVYPQVQGTPPLKMPETYTSVMPAHTLAPPFPYVYYYIGQAFDVSGGVSAPYGLTYRGYPGWCMVINDTASSNVYRFPEGADKAYLSAMMLADHASDSAYFKFGFETRFREANFADVYGTLAKGWYEVGTRLVNSEAALSGIDTLQRTILSFPTKVMGDEWKISCTTNNADHTGVLDSVVIATCQVTFGFVGTKQYFVQYYPDPSQGDEVGGKLFQSKGVTGADTTETCRAPAFSTFTVWAHPTAVGESLKAYVVVDAKALRGLVDVTTGGWHALDSVYLNGAADSVGEVVIIPSATKGFFSEYRLRTHPLAQAAANDSSSTLKVEIFGVFSP